MSPGLPVILQLEGRPCLIVGGGAVAARRAASLREAGADVTLVAPHISAEGRSLSVKLLERNYQSTDVQGAAIVVVATDDPAINAQVAADAKAVGAWVNRADDPAAGDFTTPAHAHHGPVTLAVHTSGISAAAAAAIRRELSDALDPDWPRLLEIVEPYRARIQASQPDPAARQSLLRKLTDEQAMQTFKTQGSDALREYLDKLV